ncbi:FAD-dependent monooxygenase [Streptomyces sp. NPDC006259]|uniref:FAD-dependent monooxygenase n=1 Tax=Streptomyces sp. NPDC006259 TaxID=3364740 RepID=UPI0036C50613
MEKSEVVVVGSGSTGLLLAAELALAGVEVVLDKLPERRVQAKALNLQPRTAEVFDLRGLLDDAQQRAIATVADGHFVRLPVPPSYDGWSARRPYQVGIPQAPGAGPAISRPSSVAPHCARHLLVPPGTLPIASSRGADAVRQHRPGAATDHPTVPKNPPTSQPDGAPELRNRSLIQQSSRVYGHQEFVGLFAPCTRRPDNRAETITP